MVGDQFYHNFYFSDFKTEGNETGANDENEVLVDELASISEKFNRATKFSLSSKKLLMWSKFRIMIGDID